MLDRAIDITANHDILVILSAELSTNTFKKIVSAASQVFPAFDGCASPAIDTQNNGVSIMPYITAHHGNSAITLFGASELGELTGAGNHGEKAQWVPNHPAYPPGRFTEFRI